LRGASSFNAAHLVAHAPAKSGKSYLTLLKDLFDREEPSPESQTLSYSIVGMAGVSKASLALAYANGTYKYELIYWFQCDSEENLSKGYQDLLKSFHIDYRDEEYKITDDLIKVSLLSFNCIT
jgi:hypothetical protein